MFSVAANLAKEQATRQARARSTLDISDPVLEAELSHDPSLADQIDHAQVAFIERLKGGGNYGVSHNLGKPTVPHALNDAIHHGAVAARFDDQHQTQGRRGKLNRRLRVFVLRAVNDVSPLDQLCKISRLKGKVLQSGE